MLPYKTTFKFDNLNGLVTFYTKQLGKAHKKTMSTIASMGVKGQIETNSDGELCVTMFFRTYAKYDKFNQEYLNYLFLNNE